MVIGGDFTSVKCAAGPLSWGIHSPLVQRALWKLHFLFWEIKAAASGAGLTWSTCEQVY